jgi:hypothetical protein
MLCAGSRRVDELMSNEKARCAAVGGLGQPKKRVSHEWACAREENQMTQVKSGLSSEAPREKYIKT